MKLTKVINKAKYLKKNMMETYSLLLLLKKFQKISYKKRLSLIKKQRI